MLIIKKLARKKCLQLLALLPIPPQNNSALTHDGKSPGYAGVTVAV
jgi:hypothetical protein